MLTVVIVNYNRKELLRECLDSIENLNWPKDNLEIIVVDNNSSDGSQELIKQLYPKVRLINNSSNNYCIANNLAIKEAKGEYIALVNNDVILDKNWANALLDIFKKDLSVAGVTPKILFFDGRINSTGHVELPNFYWQDRGLGEEDKGQYDRIEEVKSIPHTACIYRKLYLEEVGLLDEDFNMYMEDVDISLRLRRKKYKLYYIPEAICYHHFHGTSNEKIIEFYSERNRLLFIAKHYPEKLADFIYGKGYFKFLSSSTDSYNAFNILSDIFIKLLKEHEANLVKTLIPNLIDSIHKIIDLEKYILYKEIERQKQKEIEMLNLNLKEKEIMIKKKNAQIILLETKIREFHNSQTYRFVVRPLWFILDVIKEIMDIFNLDIFQNISIRENNLCFGYFLAYSNKVTLRGKNHYSIKVTNDTDNFSILKLKIEITYEEILYAYFIKTLNILPRTSLEVKIEYDWQDLIRFYIDDEPYPPEEFWHRDFTDSGLYSIKAILYNYKDKELDKLILYQMLE